MSGLRDQLDKDWQAQASALTRCSVISPTRVARVFHSTITSETPTPSYLTLDDIAVDPVAHEVLVAQMRRDWAQFEARYGHLVEFLELLGSATP